MEIHPIPVSDAEAVYNLRLRGLIEHPEAFGEAASEWQEKSLDDVRQWVATSDFIVGAYDKSELVGMAGLIRESRVKRMHRGYIVAMYVAPEARGQGVGHDLLQALLDSALTLKDLEEVWLGITVGNDTALRLYEKAGFETIYCQPRHLNIDGVYHDMDMMRLMLTSPEK